MKEKKELLERIKDFFNILFKVNKYEQLPENTLDKIDSKKEENIDFKEKIAVNNLEKNIDSELLDDNILIDEAEQQIDEIQNFSFPANLRGYTFKTNVIFDENSPKGSYVCSLANYDETRIEKSLPICETLNSKKARIVENTLLGLKGIIDKDYSKDLINTIMEKGFKLESDEDERFKVTEDYHLSNLLQKLLEAKQKKDIIEIPVNYLYESLKNNKGYKIKKSARLIEIETKQKEEEEIKNTDYYSIIKRYIIQGEPINFSNMSEGQIKMLKEYYIDIMKKIKETNVANEYFEFGIEYIKKLSETNQRYAQILSTYEEIDNKLKTYINTTQSKIELNKHRQTLREIIVNNYLFNELKNKFSVFDNLDIEREH